MTDDWRPRKTCIVETLIENSTFSRNEARVGSVLIMYGSNFHMTCSNLTFNKVIMDSTTAMDGSTALIWDACKLKISQSRFLNNRASGEAGEVEIRGVKSTEVADSIFDGNYVGKETYSRSSAGGGVLTLINYYFDHRYYDSAFVFIIDSTFNNCSASRGGAILLQSYKPIHLKINRSRFTKNHSVKSGGTMWLSLTEDTAKNPERCDKDYWPSWHYKSHVVFEDTTLEKNIAAEVDGAVYITNGNITISRSHFVDNFASLGSHIYTVDGSTSLKIQDSCFSHIVKKSNFSTLNSSNPSFIDFGSGGPIVLYNTTLKASPYRNKITLIAVAKSKGELDKLFLFFGK